MLRKLKNWFDGANRTTDVAFRLPRLPTNDEILRIFKEEAAILEKTTAGLVFPFEPLTGEFELDEEEYRLAEREVSNFRSHNPSLPLDRETSEAIEFSIYPDGVYHAAETKFRCGDDFQGALQSWVKWFAMDNTGVRSINKDSWLLLAKIYVGLRDPINAENALTWAGACWAAQQPNPDVDQWGQEWLKHQWESEIAEVRRQMLGTYGMYMVRNVWKCTRGKVPECLEVVKEVRDSWARDGNTTGKIYVDYTDRMDTIAFEIEVESLDDYFNNQRTNYGELSPETVESVRQFNINTVEGSRQIWEVIR